MFRASGTASISLAQHRRDRTPPLDLGPTPSPATLPGVGAPSFAQEYFSQFRKSNIDPFVNGASAIWNQGATVATSLSQGEISRAAAQHVAFNAGYASSSPLGAGMMSSALSGGLPIPGAYTVGQQLAGYVGQLDPASAMRGGEAAPLIDTVVISAVTRSAFRAPSVAPVSGTSAAVRSHVLANIAESQAARGASNFQASPLTGMLGQVDQIALRRLQLGAHVEVPAGTQGIRRMMSDLSVVSKNEVALIRMESGRRVLVMGEPNSVSLPSQTSRVIAHTHPQGSLRLSTPDIYVMNRLNQRSTVLISPRDDIGIRVPVPRFGGP